MLNFRSKNNERGAAMVEFAMVAGVVTFTLAVPLLVTLLPRYRAALDDGSVQIATQSLRQAEFPLAEIGPEGELRGVANCESEDPLTAIEESLEGLAGVDGFCAVLVGDTAAGSTYIVESSNGCDAGLTYAGLSQRIRNSHETMRAAGRRSELITFNESRAPGFFASYEVSPVASVLVEAGCPVPQNLPRYRDEDFEL